jgi:hypothetical protein
MSFSQFFDSFINQKHEEVIKKIDRSLKNENISSLMYLHKLFVLKNFPSASFTYYIQLILLVYKIC